MDKAGSPGTPPANLWYPNSSYWHEHTLCPVIGSVNKGLPVSQHLWVGVGGLPGVGAEDVTAILEGGGDGWLGPEDTALWNKDNFYNTRKQVQSRQYTRKSKNMSIFKFLVFYL
jgi:hypothetical protein